MNDTSKTPRHTVSIPPDVFLALEKIKNKLSAEFGISLSFGQTVALLVKRSEES